MKQTLSLVVLTLNFVFLVHTGAQRAECFREVELQLEIRSALTTLNERMNSMEIRLKKESNEAKKRSINQDKNYKSELLKIKDEIIAETERVLQYSQLSGINNVPLNINNDIVAVTNITTSRSLPSDCKEVQDQGFNSSGPYQIHPRLAEKPFLVWCDMKTEKGGWTYILNRVDGSGNFNLNWTDYKRGFGNLSGEHWLGLEHMYELTKSKSYKLLIELVDWKSFTAQAFYDNFKIGKESEGYPLNSLGHFRGNTGDSFSEHIGLKFSTPDRNHDNRESGDPCALTYKAGWWFDHCLRAVLTGQYIDNPIPGTNFSGRSAIKWEAFHGFSYSLKEARMMIKPAK